MFLGGHIQMCQDTSEIAAEQSRVTDVVDVEKSLEKNISN